MSERENTLFKACFPFIIIKKEVLGMPNYVKSKITGITKEQLMPYLSVMEAVKNILILKR